MRSRRVVALLLIVALFAGAVYAATPYARAASLIVRGAHLGGSIEAIAARRSYPVVARPIHTVPTRYGQVAARYYVPDKTVGHPIIVIPGIHSAGIDALSKRQSTY